MMFLLAAALLAAQPATCPADDNYDAHVCRALNAKAANDSAAAAEAFERAAATGKTSFDRDRALAAAGNLWIAANQPGKAALDLDRALAGTDLKAEQRGEALLDRARAAEAQNDLRTARSRVDDASASIGDDPFLWYFSAALAIREGDRAKAQSSINRALSLAPNDPVILFEAGHVAQFAGNASEARRYWTQAQRLDAKGAIGKMAGEALTMLPPAEGPIVAPQGR
ncbi:hypothetical protein G7077_06145 [Sphingomonas piscis]|uniref:Uncharacterized protein n=1 Tax=Sphingomonas piscis TaxID=2714943 RepID=A0A6G7YP75_9SPHN|nr:hypothetical protein [Sphingomonas piscis]QIK78543.1 hypothetical protein G7077_06145 [Sphingomonas piscis]